MKKKLVSVLLAAVMTVSSVSVASATSMDPVAESFDNEELSTETENETEPPETETQESESSVVSVPDTGDDVLSDGSTSSKDNLISDPDVTQTESETQPAEDSQKNVTVKAEKADVFFASDLKKLKDGTLEDPDIKEDSLSDNTIETEAETESQEEKDKRTAAIKAAEKVLPEEYSSLLSDDSYKLLMKQKHSFQVSDYVDFYVVPEDGYDVDNVKVSSSLYGELQVTDYENGVYEVNCPLCQGHFELV